MALCFYLIFYFYQYSLSNKIRCFLLGACSFMTISLLIKLKILDIDKTLISTFIWPTLRFHLQATKRHRGHLKGLVKKIYVVQWTIFLFSTKYIHLLYFHLNFWYNCLVLLLHIQVQLERNENNCIFIKFCMLSQLASMLTSNHKISWSNIYTLILTD